MPFFHVVMLTLHFVDRASKILESKRTVNTQMVKHLINLINEQKEHQSKSSHSRRLLPRVDSSQFADMVHILKFSFIYTSKNLNLEMELSIN